MSAPPTISVVITVHERRTYVREAVRSVLQQDLDRSRFEVLVVRKLVDAELGAFLREHGVRDLEVTDDGIGAKVARGIQEARGGVIAILEDDDRFLPQALSWVFRAFTSDPELVYLHHGFTAMDPQGNAVPNSRFKAAAAQRLRRHGPVHLSSAGKSREMEALWGKDADFNCSCIAVRRSTYLPFLGEMREVPVTVDTFLLAVALLVPGSLLVDPTPLTLYRLHGENLSTAMTPEDPAYLDSLARYTDRSLVGYRLIAALAGRSSDPRVQRVLRSWAQVHAIYQLLRGRQRSRAEMARRLLAVAPYMATFVGRAERTTIVAALLYLLSPDLLRRSYVGYKRFDLGR